jgi:hypothetical protein
MAIDTDYLVIGAGLGGLAFVDALIEGCDASAVIVDRRHAPGGHWIDCYPFVRLHQPSRLYGVPSTPLGRDRIHSTGPDAGLYERATGSELCGYFDQVMQHRLLASGRVRFLPRHEYLGNGRVRSLVTGRFEDITVRKRLVDANYLQAAVPATLAPPFEVADAARCVPAGDVARLDAPKAGYVIIGAGKTSMDTCQWLLEQGTDPERIRWIRPRDLWLLNRKHFQGGRFVKEVIEGMVLQLECGAAANDVDGFFESCDAAGVMLRIDPKVKPTMMRGATSDAREIALLRRVEQVVRMGHVQRIEADRIVLEGGTIPTSADRLHVHCAADGAPARPPVPIFQPDRITLQTIRQGSPSFSYAITGFLESTGRDDTEKNRLVQPNAMMTTTLDWVRTLYQTLSMERAWGQESDLESWMNGTRLNIMYGMNEAAKSESGDALMQRFGQSFGPGLARMQSMFAAATREERSRFWPPTRRTTR